MNLLKVKGYLVLFLKEIPICDLETLKKDPELDFKSEYAFYLSHIKTSFYDLNDSYMLSEELVGNISRAWLQRFKRLQIVSSRIYYASLHYTSDKIPNIVNTCKEEEYHRIIIFQSNDVVAHYAEFIEIFHLNSFLYQRYTKPRTLEAKYSSGGFINKKKLERVLRGKGRGVFEETFKLIRPVVDKNILNNVDSIHPSVSYREA